MKIVSILGYKVFVRDWVDDSPVFRIYAGKEEVTDFWLLSKIHCELVDQRRREINAANEELEAYYSEMRL